MANESYPKTLQEAIIYFSNPQNCFNYLVARRWPNGVICPTCGRTDPSFLTNQNKWQCKSAHKKRQFTLKTGTIFEDSPLGFDKWLPAVWLVVNCKNGISSYEVARDLGVEQRTAWFMTHRIRLALQIGSFEKKLSGHVEVDESFIGGAARFMHKNVRDRRDIRAGLARKVAVLGLLERHGTVRTHVVPNVRISSLMKHVNDNVEAGSNVYTDSLKSYELLTQRYVHGVINHAEKYVEGQIHTNGIENYWSLLKRTIKGTYVCIEPFHLHRYLDEQSFRFNNRKVKDADRFRLATEQIVGKRLTYVELTGKSKEGVRQEN
jgi:transposase-like protein